MENVDLGSVRRFEDALQASGLSRATAALYGSHVRGLVKMCRGEWSAEAVEKKDSILRPERRYQFRSAVRRFAAWFKEQGEGLFDLPVPVFPDRKGVVSFITPFRHPLTMEIQELQALTGYRPLELSRLRWDAFRVVDETQATIEAAGGRRVPVSKGFMWIFCEWGRKGSHYIQGKYILPSSPMSEEPIDAKELEWILREANKIRPVATLTDPGAGRTLPPMFEKPDP